MTLAKPGWDEFRATGDDEESAQLRYPVDKAVENYQRRRADPMDVFQQREQWRLNSQPFEEREQGSDQTLFLFSRRHLKRRIVPFEKNRTKRCHEWNNVRGSSRERRAMDSSFSIGALGPLRSKTLPRAKFDGRSDETHRSCGGGTLVADREMPLVGGPFAQAGQDAQLADAGLAREQRDFAFAGACVPPSFDKQGAVMRLDRDASKRVSVSASRNTAHARIGASNPFRSFGSRDLSSKVSPRRRRV